MSRWHIERQAEREHDAIAADVEQGRISQREANELHRQVERDAADAMAAEIAERHQEIEDEYYGW